MWARVVHTFWPLTSHSSPSRSAFIASEATSEPAPGSENSWHQMCSLENSGRSRAVCSSVPWVTTAGAHMP